MAVTIQKRHHPLCHIHAPAWVRRMAKPRCVLSNVSQVGTEPGSKLPEFVPGLESQASLSVVTQSADRQKPGQEFGLRRQQLDFCMVCLQERERTPRMSFGCPFVSLATHPQQGWYPQKRVTLGRVLFSPMIPRRSAAAGRSASATRPHPESWASRGTVKATSSGKFGNELSLCFRCKMGATKLPETNLAKGSTLAQASRVTSPPGAPRFLVTPLGLAVFDSPCRLLPPAPRSSDWFPLRYGERVEILCLQRHLQVPSS